jgi:hypothetical protein
MKIIAFHMVTYKEQKFFVYLYMDPEHISSRMYYMGHKKC